MQFFESKDLAGLEGLDESKTPLGTNVISLKNQGINRDI